MSVRFKHFCFLAILALGVGCSETTVEPTAGAISGTVTPAQAASQVYLIKGADTLKTEARQDGTYELSEITPGNYRLSAKPNFGFTAPVAGPIIINAGFTTQAYPIRMPEMPAVGTFTISLNDSVLTGSPMYGLAGESSFSVSSGPYLFKFQLPKISGTGSFNTTTNNDMSLEVHYNKQVWEANSNQGNLALEVTFFDAATNKGNATFTFTAVRSGEPDLVGKNGELQFIKFGR